MKKLGFIGEGNMATAIAQGILRNGTLSPQEMMVYGIDSEKLQRYAEWGIERATSEANLVENCKYVLLAVKPQIFPEALAAAAPACRPDSVFVSIAAGISGDGIKKMLGYDAKVILVMPNTPLMVGCGASVLARVEPATQAEFDEVLPVFAASGVAVQVEPEQINLGLVTHGSMPALFYWMAQICVEFCAEKGLAPEKANELFCQAMTGSARMMLETGKPHQELIDMVSSKGGTTLAMRQALEQNGFRDVLLTGLDACLQRGIELGQQ